MADARGARDGLRLQVAGHRLLNEARLTPRSDSRQNVILNRVETVPATRNYRYVDYWGTAVTAFDLHAPHTELEVTSSSVVETDKSEPPAKTITFEGLAADGVGTDSTRCSPDALHPGQSQARTGG